MAVDPDLVEDIAASVADIYREAETALNRLVARHLAAGLDSPTAERRLGGVRALRRGAQAIIAALEADSGPAIRQALADAYRHGWQAAVADLPERWFPRSGIGQAARQALEAIPGFGFVEALANALHRDVGRVHDNILRNVMDAYRSVQAAAAARILTGTQTRQQAAQSAWQALVDRGLTSFTDRAGRRWRLSSYVEMATRTNAQRAATTAQVDRLDTLGVDLVYVSDSVQECELCLVPGTVVEGPVPTGRTRSEYTGDIVRIVTASGNDLTGTPDHPVLTPHGWVALKDFAVGDQVISHDREKGFAGVVPDDVQVPTLIEEAGKAWLPVLLAGPTRRHLDKNIAYRKVRYVPADSDLPDEFDPTLSEPVPEQLLVSRVSARGALFGLDDRELGRLGPGSTGVGKVHGVEHLVAFFGTGVLPAFEHPRTGESGPFFVGQSGHVRNHSAMPGTGLDPGTAQIVADYPTADAEGGAELLRALTGKVTADEVVSLSVSQFSGHVWDLSTEPSWYVANGIVTHNCRPWEHEVIRTNPGPTGWMAVEHATQDRRMVSVNVKATLDEARAAGLFHPNCRHSVSVWLPGVTKFPMRETKDPEGDKARQKQRAIEREIRKQKERAGAALTDEARKAANKRVRAAQAGMREHLRDHPDLKRLPYRERIGAGNIPPRGTGDASGGLGPPASPTLDS